MADDSEWVTYLEAARMIGCSPGLVGRMVKSGELEARGRQEQRWLPTISRVSALEVAEARAERQRLAELRRTARPAWLPPDDGNVWLSPQEAGLVIGLTHMGVRYRAIHGLIPATRCGGRWWLRRDHVEQAAAARVFQRRRSADGVKR